MMRVLKRAKVAPFPLKMGGRPKIARSPDPFEGPPKLIVVPTVALTVTALLPVT